MSKQKSSAKSLIITDDEQQEEEQLNPFSFREFLRWKNQDQDEDEDHDQQHTDGEASSSQKLFEFDPESVTFDPESLTFDTEVRSCFFVDPSLAPQANEEEEEEEEEEGWRQSFQCASVDRTSSLCTEEEETTRFSSKPEEHLGGAGGTEVENYETDEEAEALTSCRRSADMQQLKQENVMLRRTIKGLQKKWAVSEHRSAKLSEELFQRRRQEEQEAQDLESMVQSVEQNLKHMTKRALKAESSVTKLKQEVKQLQVQVDTYRVDNELMKEAESEVVMAMRQKAQIAAEYLNKTTSHAHSSIQQLLGGAETLRLVSQLLQSIDKISNLNPEHES
ncbi:endosome-associated-trafficking regulator 1 [Genypterus blacodes]|uniref:endosome-associated-trafficking regulator 1 n=1 Tax=Genypterus blacodes TaxID=154954 RepID=UPI003F773C2D